MSHDDWVRAVTVTTADLEAGDWETRDRNPVALAIARVLRSDVTLYVDIRQEEYWVGRGTHKSWFLLPTEFRDYAARVLYEGYTGELTVEMGFASWAIVTERSVRKDQRGEL
jgi:hypothetical protein